MVNGSTHMPCCVSFCVHRTGHGWDATTGAMYLSCKSVVLGHQTQRVAQATLQRIDRDGAGRTEASLSVTKEGDDGKEESEASGRNASQSTASLAERTAHPPTAQSSKY